MTKIPEKIVSWKDNHIFQVMMVIIFLTPIYTFLLSTGDIQDDAYIIFRSAFNLADHGQLTFNLGEAHSGATSYLYPLFVALVRTVSGDQAVAVILIVNSIAMLLTTYMLTGILGRAFDFSNTIRLVTWAVLAIAPATLLMAVRGMETPYVVLIFILGLCGIQYAPRRFISLLPLVALPFIRPDAIAFSLILVGFSYSAAPGIWQRYLTAAISGVAMLAVANYFTFGSLMSATMTAKSFGILETRSLLGVMLDELVIYFNSPLFSPVSTKYLIPFYPLFSVFALILSTLLLWKLWHIKRPYFSIVAALLAGVWLIPGAYGLGGVIFRWYLWPPRLLYQGVLITGTLYLLGSYLRPFKASLFAYILLGGLFSATAFQLLLSYSWGVHESGYKASVGKYIASQANEDDTLYLEPAGYIPFFAKIRTIDEVGLASPVILKYKRDYPLQWWIEAVKQEKPTFLVQRSRDIVYHRTYQGYQMTPTEAAWFDSQYELIRIFKYRPEEFTDHSFLQWLLRFGSQVDYHVFKLRDSR